MGEHREHRRFRWFGFFRLAVHWRLQISSQSQYHVTVNLQNIFTSPTADIPLQVIVNYSVDDSLKACYNTVHIGIKEVKFILLLLPLFKQIPWNNLWLSPSGLSVAMSHEAEPTRDIRCEFCGEYFENRKGLSSHARSHLRQMGITEWSVNGSPIDTLREVMHKRGAGGSSHSDQAVKKESSQGANSPLWESAGGTGGSEGLGVLGYQSTKYRKSPLSLLQSGSRLHKQGLSSMGTAATPPAGKYFRMSPLGKRPLSEDAKSVETGHSPPHQLKTFSPLPQDFSFKRKPSPDKPGHQGESLLGLCFSLHSLLFFSLSLFPVYFRSQLRALWLLLWEP